MSLKRFDCKNTFLEALHNGINLFVGAGFSIHAKDELGNNLPTGKHLLSELHLAKFL